MDWSNLIVGAVIGFVVSIIANIYTDKYKDWMARRTISTKNKRKEQLKKDLERFSEYKKEPIKFYMMIARRMFIALWNLQILIFFTFLVLGGSILSSVDRFLKLRISYWPAIPSELQVYVNMFSVILLLGILAMGMFSFDSTVRDINTFINYDDFKKSINDRIKELS